jgi:poly-gamma-glutamate capsule biosynthesis protein CapA/YwtB (metallophosphatase superfamily)
MNLLLAGNVVLGRSINAVRREYGAAYPWGNTLPLLNSADLRVCALACTVADHGEPVEGGEVFQADASNIEVLVKAGVDAVALANKHVLDLGTYALQEMLGVLRDAGIAYAGAGMDSAAARAPAALYANAEPLTLYAVTENAHTQSAREGVPGVYYAPMDPNDGRFKECLEMVGHSRAEGDAVVVCIDWHVSHAHEGSARQQACARMLIDAGAGVVFGHGPRAARGVEAYRGGIIVYGAGSFVHDLEVDKVERNDESMIFVVNVVGGTVGKLSMYPVVIEQMRVMLADKDRASRIAERMRQLCAALGTLATWDGDHMRLEVRP